MMSFPAWFHVPSWWSLSLVPCPFWGVSVQGVSAQRGLCLGVSVQGVPGQLPPPNAEEWAVRMKLKEFGPPGGVPGAPLRSTNDWDHTALLVTIFTQKC